MTIPTFLPLNEAAARTGWTVERLRELVAAGTIMAGKLPDGEVIIAVDESGTAIETPAEAETGSDERELPLAAAGDDINAQLAAIRREDFEHLRGNPITVSEAARRYGEKHNINLVGQTIRDWARRGYIRVLRPSSGRGSYMELDEADVAYCVSIHVIRKQHKSRAPLLDENGRPYLLKYPKLAKARRIAKTVP